MLDYKTIYRDIAPKADIVSGALAYARGRVGAAGVVTLDILKEGAVEVVKTLARDKLKPGVVGLLENAVAGYQIVNGERPFRDVQPELTQPAEQEAVNAWIDGFDAHLEAAIGADLAKAIGPSCMGEHFTDSDVDNPEVLASVAHEMSERLAESAMPMDMSDLENIKPSVNKTLSAAGVVDADFLPYTTGGQVAEQSKEEVIDEPTARGRVEKIVGEFVLRVGADKFDPFVMTELLDTAFDDDHFISLGAIERLGGSDADRPFFLAYVKAAPLEAKGNTMNAALAALATGATVEPPKPVKGKKIKVAKGGAAGSLSPAAPPPAPPPAPPSATPNAGSLPTGQSGGAGTGDYASVVNLWREHGKDTDEKIGQAIGVSRAQVSNIGSGKSKLPLDQTQRAKLKGLLQAKAAGLLSAAALLD